MKNPETPETTPGINGVGFAILPARVLYACDISDGAKILFGIILALSNNSGVCFASNARLAEARGVSERTVRAWVGELEAAGVVTVELSTNGGARKVFPASEMFSKAPATPAVGGGRKKTSGGVEEDSRGGGRKLPPEEESIREISKNERIGAAEPRSFVLESEKAKIETTPATSAFLKAIDLEENRKTVALCIQLSAAGLLDIGYARLVKAKYPGPDKSGHRVRALERGECAKSFQDEKKELSRQTEAKRRREEIEATRCPVCGSHVEDRMDLLKCINPGCRWYSKMDPAEVAAYKANPQAWEAEEDAKIKEMVAAFADNRAAS